jgi:hypothetical protein
MIKIQGTQRTIRETTSEFEHFEGGEIKKETIRVKYYSPTITELRSLEKELKAKFKESSQSGEGESTFYLTEFLVKRLHALPDLADGKGKPFKITLENIESLDVKNLERIRDAINDDLNPKAQAAS